MESHDRWTLLDRLGSGGFGVVYLARHERPPLDYQRQVAIKILHPHTTTPELLQRFQDEARLLGRVRHGAIVGSGPPLRLVDRSGSLYGGAPVDAIVMDLAPGLPLSTWTAAGLALPPTVALAVVGRVAEVLHEVHQQTWEGEPLRLVHRDLKPSNLLLSRGGDVRVLDLGIARANATFLMDRQRTRGVLGTAGYVAPERMRDTHSDDHQAVDVFSLGVVLHELLTGRLPEDEGRPPTLIPSGDDLLVDALALSREMRSAQPDQRPTMRDVARRCAALQRRVTGVALADWCELHVVEKVDVTRVTGVVLVEHREGAAPGPAVADTPLDSGPPSPSGLTAPLNSWSPRASLAGAGLLAAVTLGLVMAGLRPSVETTAPTEVAAEQAPQASPPVVTPPAPQADPVPSSAAAPPQAAPPQAAPVLPSAAAQPRPTAPQAPPPAPAPRPTTPAPTTPPPAPTSASPAPTIPPEPPAPQPGAVRFSDPSLRGVLSSGGRRVQVPSADVPPGAWALELRHGDTSAPALDERGAPLVLQVGEGASIRLVCSLVNWRCRRQ